jgi:hypothetical protein
MTDTTEAEVTKKRIAGRANQNVVLIGMMSVQTPTNPRGMSPHRMEITVENVRISRVKVCQSTANSINLWGNEDERIILQSRAIKRTIQANSTPWIASSLIT